MRLDSRERPTKSLRNYSSKWNRALSAGLYLLILVSYVLYTWVVLDDARETRISNALDRNQATAALGARFVDVQWRNILTKTRELARQKMLAPTVRALDSRRAREILHAEHRSLPELLSVSVYLPEGKLLASDPPETAVGPVGDDSGPIPSEATSPSMNGERPEVPPS